MPVVIALHHRGLLLAVGAGGTAVLLLPGPSRREVPSLAAHRGRSVRIGAAGALLWAMSSIALLPLGGLEAAGAGSGLDVWSIALSGELGKLRLAVAIAALLAALSYALARSTVLACWGLAFTGIGAAKSGRAACRERGGNAVVKGRQHEKRAHDT